MWARKPSLFITINFGSYLIFPAVCEMMTIPHPPPSLPHTSMYGLLCPHLGLIHLLIRPNRHVQSLGRARQQDSEKKKHGRKGMSQPREGCAACPASLWSLQALPGFPGQKNREGWQEGQGEVPGMHGAICV